MEFNSSTFVFEIINFLILLWILQRFLYKPVLAVIAKRRQGIEDILAEANATRSDAKALQTQYENRLASWEQEQQAARQTLQQSIDAERQRLLDDLQTTLANEREKAQVIDQRRWQDQQRQLETAALAQAGRFAARLLTELAGPELEIRLSYKVIDELGSLDNEQVAALRAAYSANPTPIRITSAYALNPDVRANLEQALQTLLNDTSIQSHYEQDTALIAGLRISLGSWLLRANLQDELKDFADAAQTPQQASVRWKTNV